MHFAAGPASATLVALLLGGGAWWAAGWVLEFFSLGVLGLVGQLGLLFLALGLMEVGFGRLAAPSRHAKRGN